MPNVEPSAYACFLPCGGARDRNNYRWTKGEMFLDANDHAHRKSPQVLSQV